MVNRANHLRKPVGGLGKHSRLRKSASPADNQDMRKKENIVFRGYTKFDGKRWVAICIDLDIAAQGATHKEATKTCCDMMLEYLRYVIAHERRHLQKFLFRPAPQEFIDEYYAILNQRLQPTALPVTKASPKSKARVSTGNMVHNFSVNPYRLNACSA